LTEACKISTVFGHFALMRLPQASPDVGGLVSLFSFITATISALAAASLFTPAKNFSILSKSSGVRGMAPAFLSSLSGMAAGAAGVAAKANRTIPASAALIEGVARREMKLVVCLGVDGGFIPRG
jgi:hypothetical protein